MSSAESPDPLLVLNLNLGVRTPYYCFQNDFTLYPSHTAATPVQIRSSVESIDLFLSSLCFLCPLRAPVLFNLQHNGLPLYPSLRPRNCKRLEGKLQGDALKRAVLSNGYRTVRKFMLAFYFM